ncbi:MarR family winged helix-turn-helix transcriptional regulator [Amycolatopsis pithecellobii]|uniref:MarR family transcriptional regulator n=1 Tax=Amycolatopsis pithecellobii TaxID=664692 RepID=A0A6N7Z0J3_9PSEU|nr:MarR family transcriptional regulator [Amycolatopsis pithecellobii]MTD53110.1 MarR family transcriptional regulator [Amycolatopsis pithecellobii]
MAGEEVERLLGQIKVLNRRLRRERSAVEGLSTAALVVLTAATRADSPQRPGQLAAELQMTSPNMAAALRMLEDAGMITRHPDPGDGRKVFVHVTKRGRDVVARTSAGRHAWLSEAVEYALTDRERRLLFQAGDLIERIAEYDAGPATPQRGRRAASNRR